MAFLLPQARPSAPAVRIRPSRSASRTDANPLNAYLARVSGSALKFHSPTWMAMAEARFGTVTLIMVRRVARSWDMAGSSASS